jgi:uncharacterized protein YfbU (UPF0304 family)
VIFRSVVALIDRTPKAVAASRGARHQPCRSCQTPAERAVRFDGFDLNHRLETRLLLFARHLAEQGKWEQLTTYFDDQHERGNSHHRTIDAYERMLGRSSTQSGEAKSVLPRGEAQSASG